MTVCFDSVTDIS